MLLGDEDSTDPHSLDKVETEDPIFDLAKPEVPVVWIASWVRAFDQCFGFSLPVAAEIPGAILVALGAILTHACAGVFIPRGRGTTAIFDAPHAFVAIGPYRYVRHPMYMGGLMLLLGFSLYMRWISILFLTLLLLLLVTVRRLLRRPYADTEIRKLLPGIPQIRAPLDSAPVRVMAIVAIGVRFEGGSQAIR
ncbi:MAG: methyltransferase [Terriglobia bacterium]|jgi:protein-S-isoprenylcysteine O-methyltransferase Ste14